MSFRYIPYLISQYAWIMVLAVFVCIPFMIPRNNETGIINSRQNYTKFNSSSIPVTFAHITDPHVNTKIPKNNKNFESAVNILNDIIKPTYTFITGDLADNFQGLSIPKYGKQMPKDFDLYINISNGLKNTKIVETDGNHDLFGIYDFNSKKKSNENQTLSEYRISVFELNTNGPSNFSLIAMNPYNFPSPHPPLLFYAHPDREFLDLLEENIQSEKQKGNEIILFNHFPYHHWKYGASSSQGNTFHEILHKYDIGFLIDGHLHPDMPYLQHHKDILEIIGTDLKDHDRFGIVVIDNDRLSYHSIDVTKDYQKNALAFVTNPLPNEVLTSHQIFNEKVTSLRMVVYSADVSPKIHAKILQNSLIDTDLTCQKENDHQMFYLCQAELSLEFGTYEIEITSSNLKNVDQTIKFTIGDSIPSFTEKVYQRSSTYVSPYFVQMAIVWIFLLIINVPYPLPTFLKNYMPWIEGLTNDSKWLVSFFLGFLTVKVRINRLPKLIRYSLLIGVIWPFFMPLVFTNIGGHFSCVWTWGYLCEGAHYDVWGQMFCLMYLSGVLLPVTIFSSALAISLPLRWTLLLEVCSPLVTFCYCDVYIVLRWCWETSGIYGSLLSPGFVIAPLYYYILLIVWRCKWKKGLKEECLIPSAALLEHQN
ncbi:Ser/Thr protein phosphatase [Tritrichomonas foetus]|uniref:Ser/Thr protein phosphatase n=1 Tax=Tritrichomonas foetus TaxID=1144522 RepID=A0A1J4JP12_9EUKA|nr:Ser/Thr protein phosphatase [Tritrichomonas foetus]|eukprot:OHT00152.1 Ser/Thr protein phosphatase [Tritrichomonas foetus]